MFTREYLDESHLRSPIMSMTSRFAAVLLGVALVSAGCDKSSTTPPGKPADETYGKKLVGVWEGTDPEMKGPKGESMTMEFKADGGFKVALGPDPIITGTWKLAKEEGKTLTVDTEASFGDPKAPGKPEKKTMSIVFEDENTIEVSQGGGKAKSEKLKRKS
jgi:hypothetical protein